MLYTEKITVYSETHKSSKPLCRQNVKFLQAKSVVYLCKLTLGGRSTNRWASKSYVLMLSSYILFGCYTRMWLLLNKVNNAIGQATPICKRFVWFLFKKCSYFGQPRLWLSQLSLFSKHEMIRDIWCWHEPYCPEINTRSQANNRYQFRNCTVNI